MNSIFKGDLSTAGGRALAWLDALLVDHAVFRLVWSNFAPVVPGRLYRCNHPTPARLAALTRRYGLKTLINLRGETGNGSDALSRTAAHELGLEFIDAPLDSRGAPQRERILRLHDIFRQMRGNLAETQQRCVTDQAVNSGCLDLRQAVQFKFG
jgi:hypothetical protein